MKDEVLYGTIDLHEYVVSCYGYWKSLDVINFNVLPNRIFLKPNDVERLFLMDKKKGIDRKKVHCRFNLNTLVRRNYY